MTEQVSTSSLQQFCASHSLPASYIPLAEQWFLPLAKSLVAHHDSAGGSLLVGINGCQGSGKSTLSDLLVLLFEQVYGLRAICLSLDDFYLCQDARQVLAEQVHPLLATRGVPGTHNIDRMSLTVNELFSEGLRVAVQKFNKATDNPFLPEDWPVVKGAMDVVILEGWCLGTPPQPEQDLAAPVNELEALEDPDGAWRHFVNLQLGGDYQMLFHQVDAWVMLKTPGFDCVHRWRLEQEQKLAKSSPGGRGVMNEEQVARFIQHYQRLTEHSLKVLPPEMHFLYELGENRQILQCSSPKPLVVE